MMAFILFFLLFAPKHFWVRMIYIYIDGIPSSTNNIQLNHSYTPSSTMSVCRSINQFSDGVKVESEKVNNLLNALQQYYSEIKTCRQLNFEVPAGFRQKNQYQKMCHDAHIYHLSQSDPPAYDTSIDDSTLLPGDYQEVPPMHNNTMASTNVATEESSNIQVPILRCVNKVSSSLPSRITMNEDYIRACIGFRHIDTIKRHLSSLYQDSVKLDGSPADAVLDQGDLATVRKTPRNTVPVPRSLNFGDVIHMDIVFGPEVALANVHYGLLFTDRHSRMTYIYPLHNLTTDIPKQLDAFFAHLGFSPKRLITDFDLKLIGGKARDHLNKLHIHVNAAPASRQDRNGLAE